MRDQKVIGLDIGGTKVHFGLVQNGIILDELKLPTPTRATQDRILAELIAGIEALMAPEVVGIGIGVPGLVDEENGIVYNVQNIPAFQEVPLKNTWKIIFTSRFF